MNRITVFLIFLVLIISSCRSRHKKPAIDLNNDEGLYFDYQVWGDDEKGTITVMLQYRRGGPENKGIVLTAPAKVELDGKQLKADSSKMSGTWYESESTVDSFAGVHSIIFTDEEGNVYHEQFEFRPFTLRTKLGDTIHRTGLVLDLVNLDKEDYIRVIAIDTVFRSRGINELDTIKDGHLTVSKQLLKNLANGPVKMEFYKEEEKPVKNGGPAGGVLLITYAIKREFELAD
jgi:hypothetical protein